MKTIIYKKIKLQDFKCFGNKEFSFSNKRNRIKGSNGTGKTTLSESLVFTLIGKTLIGGKLANEPIDAEGSIKENYNQKLNITIEVDGKDYVIEKEIVNASVKKLTINKETFNKLADFNKEILKILGVDSNEEFLILSNPKYLNSLDNKTARRYLISLINNKPDFEFVSLKTPENDVLNEYKTILVKELTEGISLNNLLDSKTQELKNIKKEIEDYKLLLNSKNETLTKISQDNQLNLETLDKLKEKKTNLQNEISDINRKNELIVTKKTEFNKLKNEIENISIKIKSNNQDIEQNNTTKQSYSLELETLKGEFEALAAKQPSSICPMCNKESPNMQAHFEQEKNKKLDLMDIKFKEIKEKIVSIDKNIINSKENIKILENELKILETKKTALEFEDNELKNTTTLNDEISKINETIGSYDAINIIKTELNEIQDKLNHKEKLFDQLEQEEFFLMDILKDKATYYNKTINSQLKNSKVSLFELKKNGNIKEIFTITRNGIKYNLLNWANQINAGIELITFLQAQKNINLPIFIDNAEAVNQLQTFESQSFESYVNTGTLEVS